MGGGPTEDIESQTVEDHTNHQHQAVAHLQQGGASPSFTTQTSSPSYFNPLLSHMTFSAPPKSSNNSVVNTLTNKLKSHHERDPHSVEVLVQLHIQVGQPVQVWRTPPLVPGGAVSGVWSQEGQEGLSGGSGADVGRKNLHWLEKDD